MTEPWTAIGAISSAVGTAVVLVTAIIALRQIGVAAQARHVDVLGKVFESFHSDEARQDRRFIYESAFDDYSALSPEIRDRIDRVIDLYERTAFLAIRSLIPTDLILGMYSGTYIVVWNKLDSYICDKRIATGLSNYGGAFETLAKKARVYRKKRYKEKSQRYLFGLAASSAETDSQRPNIENDTLASPGPNLEEDPTDSAIAPRQVEVPLQPLRMQNEADPKGDGER